MRYVYIKIIIISQMLQFSPYCDMLHCGHSTQDQFQPMDEGLKFFHAKLNLKRKQDKTQNSLDLKYTGKDVYCLNI